MASFFCTSGVCIGIYFNSGLMWSFFFRNACRRSCRLYKRTHRLELNWTWIECVVICLSKFLSSIAIDSCIDIIKNIIVCGVYVFISFVKFIIMQLILTYFACGIISINLSSLYKYVCFMYQESNPTAQN